VQVYPLKLEFIEVELDFAVSETGKVGCNFLVVAAAVAPLDEVALHLVGCVAGEDITVLSGRHRLKLVEEAEHHLAVVADGNAGHRVCHWLRFLGYLVGVGYVNGIVDIELEVGHDSEMVPKLLLLLGVAVAFDRHALHGGNDGLGTTLALASVGNGNTVVDHALNFAAVFGKDEFLPLCVVI